MRKFFEDSSQAKILSKDKDIRYAVRHMSKKNVPMEYELREYFPDGNYGLVDSFTTKQGALIAKEFATLQYGPHFAVVAVTPIYMRRKVNLSSTYGKTVTLSEKELEYMNRDESIVNLVKGVGGD